MPNAPMKKMSAKNMTQAFGGAAVLTLAAGGGLVFWLNGRIVAQQQAQVNLQAQVGSSEKITKQLEVTQAAYHAAQDKLALLETSVSQNSYVPTLLQQIQQLASTTNLSVNSLHPGTVTTPAAPAAPAKSDDSSSDSSAKKAAPAPTYQTMDVDLNVSGTYADTARFLYGLTRFPKVLSVISVQMSPGQSGPGSGQPQVSTTVKLAAYIFPDDPSSTATVAAGQPAPGAPVGPAPAAPTLAGAAGRAAQSAVTATKAADEHAAAGTRVL